MDWIHGYNYDPETKSLFTALTLSIAPPKTHGKASTSSTVKSRNSGGSLRIFRFITSLEGFPIRAYHMSIERPLSLVSVLLCFFFVGSVGLDGSGVSGTSSADGGGVSSCCFSSMGSSSSSDNGSVTSLGSTRGSLLDSLFDSLQSSLAGLTGVDMSLVLQLLRSSTTTNAGDDTLCNLFFLSFSSVLFS